MSITIDDEVLRTATMIRVAHNDHRATANQYDNQIMLSIEHRYYQNLTTKQVCIRLESKFIFLNLTKKVI